MLYILKCGYTVMGSPIAFVEATRHIIIVFSMQVKFWNSPIFRGGRLKHLILRKCLRKIILVGELTFFFN